MQKGHVLEFHCLSCEQPIHFSIFQSENEELELSCTSCEKKYFFDDATLLRQMKKFEALCAQLVESEEILSQTAVGVDVGKHQVKIPFKLLLTRLNSSLDLMIGDEPLKITFRIEPLKDAPSLLT